ncbi:unnamed protein product [Cuscuta campestris]|uniref:SANT domain-containing protein n=1 Tax=Cuscuta campestris TaxID=132261 RepID=A0A484KHW0_9ASTE|nr:unnamed protein product [Cuscuta campestris]
MPPEPSPWDRKDFFRERNHERSEFIGGGGGGGGPGGFGGGTRWREHPGNNHHYSSSSRWAPRFPPGHSKQGGWHMYPDEPAHEFLASRSNEKIPEEDSGRYSGYRGEGRYNRNGRDNRGSFGQRDWRSHSWESASPNGPGRMNEPSDQRFGDGMMNYHHAQPQNDSINLRDQTHSRDQQNKSNSSGLAGIGQRNERESSFGSTEWKHLKWTRPGSLSSRGSFSHSSSSKSTGLVSNDTTVEMHSRNLTPIQSTSGDTNACVASSVPLEESKSRKKPRLGWGEGLAKYEKKRVEGPDDSPIKIGTVNSGSNLEVSHFSSVVLPDKIPQGIGSSDCASPTTPLSVACSSSPGLEEKQFLKETNAEHNLGGMLGSPSAVSHSHPEDVVFNLESLDVPKISNLNAKINELLRSDDPSPTDNGVIRSSKLNKLLSLKNDVSKVLEKTEFEIDMLENELKSLNSGTEHGCHGLSCGSKPFEVQAEGGKVKIVDIDSPGSATSKLVKVPPTDKDAPVSEPKCGEALLKSDVTHCGNLDMENDLPILEEGIANNASVWEETSHMIADGNPDCNGDLSCNIIYASNQESANRVSEVFKRLLPASDCSYDISKDPSLLLTVDHALKEKILKRKRQQRFKEKVLALKFRIFHHLWKEEVNTLSLRKFRTKAQRKFDLSLRPVLVGHHKHRLSSRSRPSSVGSLNPEPSLDLVNFTSRLLLDSNKVKACRSTERMPALILDKKEKVLSRFISNNALVEDPCHSEKERSMINPWTSEEREIFIDKLATFGKNFGKIASFIDHKTTADCIEFYYKNHKSDCFVKTKMKPCYAKQGKSTYLVASGKRSNYEPNAASLDILGAVSAMAANADDGAIFQMCSPKYHLGVTSENKQTNSVDACNSDRETVAADVLAGICGSLSSEAMSSCTTSSIDHHKVNSSTIRLPVAPEVMQQNTDEETCSEESCEEMMDHNDWTDEEKLTFIQAVSSYGKDFMMISRFVKTRSMDQCKIFFSKAKKCLGLDAIIGIQPSSSVGGDANRGSKSDDAEGACSLLETEPSICIEKSGIDVEPFKIKLSPEPDLAVGRDSKPDLNSPDDNGHGDLGSNVCDVDKRELEYAGDVENMTDKNMLCDGSFISSPSCREGDGVDTVKDCLPVKISCDATDVGVVDAVQNSTEGNPLPECSLNDNCEVQLAGCDDVTDSGSRMDDCLTKAADSDESETRMKSDVSSSMQGSNSSVPIQSVSSHDSTIIIASECCSNVNSKLANLNSSKPGGGNMMISESSLIVEKQISDVSRSDCNRLTESTTVKENGAPKNSWRSGRLSTSGCILQKCSSSSNHDSSLEMEKTCKNGDFKLFGQILSKPPSSRQNSSCSSSTQLEEGSTLKDSSSKSADGVSSPLGSICSSSENHLLLTYGYWGDRNRKPTGFSALPPEAAAILLAKYPAAFGSYPMPPSSTTAQMEQLSSVPIFPTNLNGVAADYQAHKNRERQHFGGGLDMTPEVVSGVQQQGRMGINVVGRGGILVGAGAVQCSGGAPDPAVVAAIKKVPYAMTEHFGGQPRESKAEIGRL